MKSFIFLRVITMVILILGTSCKENVELSPKDHSGISKNNQEALSVENLRELIHHYDYVMVDNRTNDYVCLIDFKGERLFKSDPKSVRKGKFFVKEKGTYTISSCDSDETKYIENDVKGYYETYFYQCHKIVVHKNHSVELLDSYIFRTNSESFDEACLNAEF